MEKYTSLYLWMIIPMVFMQLGIYQDYWGDFSKNAFSVHVHYWTGTIWYAFLIAQPYWATHGQLPRHRTYGIIGMFLAGGVCLTAISMLHRDIRNAERAAEMPDKFGPFQPWFFMGVAAVEIVMMIGFGYAVIKSILHRKELENHACWLVSTVFIIMFPALGRGIQNLYIGLHHNDWPNIDIMFPIYLGVGLIILLILISAWKYKKLSHPATLLALGINTINFLLEPLGKSEVVQSFLNTVIKG